jgi:hypothetical protein
MTEKPTPHFDKALYLSMLTVFLGIFMSIHLMIGRPAWESLLLSVLATLGTLLFGLWIGVNQLLVLWFKRENDPLWVPFVMPLVGFVISFAAMLVLMWLWLFTALKLAE